MKSVVLSSLAFLLLAGCIKRPERDTSVDVTLIRDLIERTAELNNAGDAEGWAALFDDTFVYMPPGLPEVTDRDELIAMARSGFASYRTNITITPAEIMVKGDFAIVRSHVTGTATPVGGGEASPIDMKQIVIYISHPDGGWRISRMIGNRNS